MRPDAGRDRAILELLDAAGLMVIARLRTEVVND